METRRWIGIGALAILLVCTAAWSCRAQDDDDLPKPAADLSIHLDPKANHATALLIVTVANSRVSELSDRDGRMTKALSAAFGGPVGKLAYTEIPDSDTTLFESPDTPNTATTSHTKAPFTSVGYSLDGLGGDQGGPIRREGLLQKGRFDPRPLSVLLRRADVPHLSISVVQSGYGKPDVTIHRIGQAGLTEAGSSTNLNPGIFLPTSDKDSTESRPLTFEAGYSATNILEALGPSALYFLCVLVIILMYRGKALAALATIERTASDPRVARAAREAVLLGYFRLINIGAPALSVSWVILCLVAGPTTLLIWCLNIKKMEAACCIGALVTVLPLALVAAVIAALSGEVARSARKDSDPVGQGVVDSPSRRLVLAGLQFLLMVLPVFCVALGVGAALDSGFVSAVALAIRHTPVAIPARLALFYQQSAGRAAGWFVLSSVLPFYAYQLIAGIAPAPPLGIGPGILVDRVNELAKKAGVRVRQVIYLPTGADRSANAYATQANDVLLTDRLLSELSRQEVDGVIAHELGHLKGNHPNILRWVTGGLGGIPIGVTIALVLAGTIPHEYVEIISTIVFPTAIVLSIVVGRAVSRAFEKQADLTAVRLTGDPAGLVLGLDRIRRLSGLPEDWGKTDANLVTHPSTARRIAYLAGSGDLSPEAQATLLARQENFEAAPESERYPFSAEFTRQSEYVFSVRWRTWHSVTTAIVGTLVYAFVPAVFAGFAESRALSQSLRGLPTDLPSMLLLYGLGAVATYLVYRGVMSILSPAPYSYLESPLRDRLIAGGKLTEAKARQALFIGLAPSVYPRLYSGASSWDMGFLLFDGDRVRYVGERIAFAIARMQLVSVRISPNNWPGATSAPTIELTWRDPLPEEISTGRMVTVRLGTAGAFTVSQSRYQLQALLKRLREWSDANEASAAETGFGEPLPTFPPTGEATPLQIKSLGFAKSGLLQRILVAFAVAELSGVPPRGVIACVATVAVLSAIAWAPYLRYREPGKPAAG